MNQNTILWGYIVLLVVGGVLGLIKGKSKISLVTSIVFALLLALPALRIWPPYAATVLLAILLLFFAWRLLKTKKFMPSGLMIILTILALALPHLLR